MKPWQWIMLGIIAGPFVLGAGKGAGLVLQGIGAIVGGLVVIIAIITVAIKTIARWPK